MSRWAWAVLLFAAAAPVGAADEFRDIFDGKTLDGWVVDGAKEYKDKDGTKQPNWKVEDGLIVTAGRGFGFLRYNQQVSDFRWKAECRLSSKGNTGFCIRCVPYDPKKDDKTRPSYAAYEVQFQDDSNPKKAPDVHCTGSLYRYVAPTKNAVKGPGEWNTIEIECVGPHIRVWINGEQVQDVDQSKIDKIKNKPLKGYVALQSHTNKVEFRNIRLKEIKAAPEK
jgi:3-keto-disaccharide hydrolase